MIIFFKSKKSNAAALLISRRCKPYQALTLSVGAGGRLFDRIAGICFQCPFGEDRGAVKTSVGSRSRTARLVRTQNLEIKYRKPTASGRATLGGLNLCVFRPGTAPLGPRAFPQNSKTFLFIPHATRGL